jgi:succinylglutamic semialdehyde dehydrogenase
VFFGKINLVFAKIVENGRGSRTVAAASLDFGSETRCTMSSAEIMSTEPATGGIIWRGWPGDVPAEVGEARDAWPEWASRPLTVRIETIRRFANVVRSKSEAMADIIARETGRPLWDARSEVEGVIAVAESSIAAYQDRTAQRRLEGALGVRSALRHKPYGVLAAISPFNFPAQIPAGQVIPALIAGNSVVLKPSERAPATAKMLVECFYAAGLPHGALRFVPGGPDEGKVLASHRDVDGLLFTGSTTTGMALHRQFAESPQKILALEMSGNNPIIAWNPADLHAAAAIIVQSAYLSAGQRCTGASRLIVNNETCEPLIAAITDVIDRIIVGDPHADPAPFMGPVVDNAAADALQEHFLDMLMLGGKAIRRLDRPLPGRPFLSPALIDVTDVQARPDRELFGPILQLIRVSDFDDAIIEANTTRYGLTASLIGGSPQMYDRFWSNIRAGVVNWNRPTTGSPVNAPFGGVGLSGNHRPSAYYAADYCAYPVISSEVEQARASIGIGLKEANTTVPSF